MYDGSIISPPVHLLLTRHLLQLYPRMAGTGDKEYSGLPLCPGDHHWTLELYISPG